MAYTIPRVRITDCCDSSQFGIFNIEGPFPTDGIYHYTGIGLSTPEMVFLNNRCYRITYEGTGPSITPITALQFSDFDFITADVNEGCIDCLNIAGISCDPPLTKLIFSSCCETYTFETQGILQSAPYGGIINYTGTPAGNFKNICYKVTREDNISIGEFGSLPAPPLEVNFTVITSNVDLDCEDVSSQCPACPNPQCYTLINCDGTYFNTWVDLSDYVGDYIEIEEFPGTWYVILNTGACNNAIISLTVIGTIAPCPCLCYEVVGNLKVLQFIDCDNRLIKDASIKKFCSRIYPIFLGTPGQFEIIQGDECVDGACPEKCYKLTNCDTPEEIFSTLQNLSQYVNTSTVVTLAGYQGCWSVSVSEPGECDCPINVIVVQEYNSCPECLPIIAYKLTGCENANDILYTYDDLSDYVDEYVKFDCGCYLVELINYQPPSVTSVVIVTSFNSCLECLRQHYILTDCNQVKDPVYTYTDLSAYLGEIITIKECGDTCWSIEETDIPINPGIVTVTDSYENCLSCTPPLPCTCNRLTNYSNEIKTYSYIDCNDNLNEIILDPNESSGKLCLKVWLTSYPETDNLEVFGECIDRQDPKFTWECPETRPKRKIKPGYSVPTCDIDKYEKITCKSSEILYKEVMRLRYGISNCCPDEDEKWLIKKELIDLASLVDPNYICKPVQTCCNNTPTCGCGCNSTLKTCNSQ